MRIMDCGLQIAKRAGACVLRDVSCFEIQNPKSEIRNPRRRAFSLVEMLVVIGIIVIILSVVLLVGQGAINDAKVNHTRVMLEQLNTAISAYSRNNPFAKINAVKQRYGPYPPDELMAFDPASATGLAIIPNLMPGGIGQFVKVGVSPINDNLADANSYVPLGAVKALVWSLRALPASREIYDSIPDRFKETAPTNVEFFDINGNGSFDPLTDKEVQYLVDGWGHPIEYFAIRELATGVGFTSHSWVSQKLVQSNKNLPVLVSYGLDGDVQFDSEQTLEQEYDDATSGDLLFTSQFHQDNIYLDDALKDRITRFEKP
ncbi:MAG: prepilin-type N-terminal cleavage/methylation domain-containing protein [Planctomycetota bacterium]|nr:prepilin-type N-terminal cleavage/methylation domain-containing protein [Planctomycetota bacterium]